MNPTPPSRPSELASFVLNSIDYMPFASMGKSFYEVYCAKAPKAEQNAPPPLSKHTFVDMSRNIHGKWTLRKIFTLVPFFGNVSLLVFDAIHWLKDSFAASTGRLDPALAPAQKQAEEWAEKVLASKDEELKSLIEDPKSFYPFLQLISPETLKKIYEWAQKKIILARSELFSKSGSSLPELIRDLDNEFIKRVSHGDSHVISILNKWEGSEEKDTTKLSLKDAAKSIKKDGMQFRKAATELYKEWLECTDSTKLIAKFKGGCFLPYFSVEECEVLYMKFVKMQGAEGLENCLEHIVSTIANSVTEFQKANDFFKRKISAAKDFRKGFNVRDFTKIFNEHRKSAGLPLHPQTFGTL